MAEVHTFKVDDKFGVPDRQVKDFLDEVEKRLGKIDIVMHTTKSETAILLTIIATKWSDDDAHG